MDQGLAAAAMSQQNDRESTNQTLQLILQQLQRGSIPTTAPANLHAKLEQDPYREDPLAPLGEAAMGPAPAVSPAALAPSGSEAAWPPLEDTPKGTGKGKDDTGRPGPY